MEDIVAVTKLMKRHKADCNTKNTEIMSYLDFHTETAATNQIMCTLYDSIIEFGSTQTKSLTTKKVAGLLVIMTKLQSTICLNQYTSPKAAFALFQTLLVERSVQRPPFSVIIFGQRDIMPITEFVLKTYFKHYKAYQVAFGLNIDASNENVPFTEVEATVLAQQ